MFTPTQSWTNRLKHKCIHSILTKDIQNNTKEKAINSYMVKDKSPIYDRKQHKRKKKEVADLEGHRERLLSSIGGPSRFGDQTLIFGLR